MSELIPVCLIGCGAVTQNFYAAALSTPTARRLLRVDWLVDPSAASIARMQPRLPAAKSAASLDAVDMPAGGLAIIATPPGLHLRQTQDCLRRGWHVLCEKPMASNSAECEAMVEAAKAADRLLAVGLYKRFFPSAHYIRELVQQGRLGKPLHYSVVEGGPFNWPMASPSFFDRRQTAGGVLLDIGVHVLDLLLWWFGEPQSFDYADDAMGGLEANCLLKMTHAGGLQGSMRLSRDWHTTNEYRIQFEQGQVAWRVNDANGLTVDLSGMPASLRSQLATRSPEPLESPLQASNPQSFTRQLLNLAEAIQGRAPLLIDGAQGSRSIRFIEACYQRRRLLGQAWITDAERQQAARLSAGVRS